MPEPVAGSPEWWRDRLILQLQARSSKVRRLEAYYEGDHPLPSPPKRLHPSAFAEMAKAFRDMAKMGVTNWVKLVADAPSERLAVTGFRFGEEEAGDADVWRIWQANHLDADQALVHDNALQTGCSAVLVWSNPDDPEGLPLICPEHSGQVIVAYAPGERRKRAAALKLWQDDYGYWLATLYLPTEIYKWRSAGTVSDPASTTSQPPVALSWKQREEEGEPWPLPNPLGVVPIVEFRCNPSLRPAPFGGGTGDFEGVLSIQDRINKTVFDRLATGEAQAFRQRFTIGWDPPLDDNGLPDPAKVARASMSMLWTFQGDPQDVKVGELGQADFSDFIKSVESDVNAMAAISQTPPHYLLGAMVNISGDALVAAESGMVSRTKKHLRNFSESWEEVLRLGLMVMDDPRATDMQTEALWQDVEHRSWAQTVDAVLKMQDLGVPQEELWLRLPGATPQLVRRWKSMGMQADLAADAAGQTEPQFEAPAEPEPELTGA